ncbi:MAG: serine hydrolase [Acidobacteria bacterium]|nr:serine hydrolase [Acidobacteriota bacterium]
MTLPRTLELLDQGRAAGWHLGGQLFVSRAGEAVADFAFGEARTGEPMSRDHLMLWLSAGKPVTATAIGQLWERGLLGLDDPVARHVPEFAAGGKEAVTVRHLLTHTGGVRALDLGWPRVSWDAIVAKVAAMKLEPRWVPGRKAGYHLSSSWFVLGEIVRRLDGRELSLYVREEIFLPLGMTDCWIGMPKERFLSYGGRIAPVYETANDPAEYDWTDEAHLTEASPGANAVGPIAQLGLFYAALLSGGATGSERILRPQTVEALTARHRVGLWDHTLRHHLDWGLGFIVNSAYHAEETSPYGYGRHASLRAFGHSGYRSTVGFADPELDLVICLAVNGTPSDDAHRERFNALTGAIYEDLGLAGSSPAAG